MEQRLSGNWGALIHHCEQKWLRKLCCLHTITFSFSHTEIPVPPDRFLPPFILPAVLSSLPHLHNSQLLDSIKSRASGKAGHPLTHSLSTSFCPWLPSGLGAPCPSQCPDIVLVVGLHPVCSEMI